MNGKVHCTWHQTFISSSLSLVTVSWNEMKSRWPRRDKGLFKSNISMPDNEHHCVNFRLTSFQSSFLQVIYLFPMYNKGSGQTDKFISTCFICGIQGSYLGDKSKRLERLVAQNMYWTRNMCTKKFPESWHSLTCIEMFLCEQLSAKTCKRTSHLSFWVSSTLHYSTELKGI